MTSLDYSSEEVMKILNNPDYNEAQKKDLFEKYKNNLKQLRRKEIINKVSSVAKSIPTFTEDDYINFMKQYENDNLSKPFDTILKEISKLEATKTNEYNLYLENKKKEEEAKAMEQISVQKEEPVVEEEITPSVQSRSEKYADVVNVPEETKTNIEIDINNSVLNEEPEVLAKPLFSSEEDVKDIMPSQIAEPMGEKGNASAIIVSIIAIIIGAVAMYTLIRLN